MRVDSGSQALSQGSSFMTRVMELWSQDFWRGGKYRRGWSFGAFGYGEYRSWIDQREGYCSIQSVERYKKKRR